jgi:hypothetical protein
MPDRHPFEERSQQSVTVPSGEVKLPVLCYDSTAVAASFVVSRAPVERLLPPRLRPAPFVPGRALMSIVCFDHRETSVGPFAQAVIAFPCVLAGGGFLAELRTFGWYVWKVAVTSALALEVSESVWGFSGLRAEIAREEDAGRQVCAVAVGGRELLRLKVAVGRRFLRDRRVFRAYAIKGDEMLSTPLETAGRVAPLVWPTSAALSLGDHALGDELHELGVHRGAAFGAAHYRELQGVLPRPDRTYPR